MGGEKRKINPEIHPAQVLGGWLHAGADHMMQPISRAYLLAHDCFGDEHLTDLSQFKLRGLAGIW